VQPGISSKPDNKTAIDIVIALDTVVMRSCLIGFYCLSVALHVVVFFSIDCIRIFIHSALLSCKCVH